MCNLQILLMESEILLNRAALNSTLCKAHNAPDGSASQFISNYKRWAEVAVS